MESDPRVHSLFAELQRRRVFRSLIAYGVGAFAVLQIIEPIMHGLHWPDSVLTYVVVALAAGFPLVVAVAWIFDLNDGRIERAAPPARGHLALVVIAAAVLATSVALVWFFTTRKPGDAPPPASIAVLPLVNLSSDKEQDYFSDGLSEELLNLLSKVPGLRVAARTSAFAFKGKNEDVRSIARQLDVSTVLEGSVRKAGDQIRVTTQLINAANGYHLWSETYDRRLNDVLALQDEIAHAVAAALQLQLLPKAAQPRRTSNVESYNEFLLGNQFFHFNNRPAFERAVQAYRRAVELDPDFAAAWAGLAISEFWFAQEGETAEVIRKWLGEARTSAEKAVTLGPDLPDGYVVRAFLRSSTDWDWAGAQKDVDRALELDPDNAETLAARGRILGAVGKLADGISSLRKSVALDPLNARTWASLGAHLFWANDLREARAALDRSLEISPEQTSTAAWLALIALTEGHPDEALATSKRSTHEIFRLQLASMAENDLGHAAESKRLLAELTANYGHSGAYQIAVAHAWRGDLDEAFHWLDVAIAQRDGGLTLAKVDPGLRNLRGDPRYRAVLRRLNLE